MRRTATRGRWAVVAASALLVAASGREPAPKAAPAEGQPPGEKAAKPSLPAADSIKPLPLEAIPDDPPPHEGAMFEITYRIEPPDLILVEVLQAWPGRLITGERLVRPDGTISLNWYGDVHVAGLTMAQAKVKILIHLRDYLTDQALGLINWNERGGSRADRKAPVPLDELPEPAPLLDLIDLGRGPLGTPPSEMPPNSNDLAERKEEGLVDPAGPPDPPAPKRDDPANHGFFPKKTNVAQPLRAPLVPPIPGVVQKEAGKPSAEPKADDGAADPPNSGGKYVYVDPAESHNVFVDVTAYNSKVYYVLGDVGSPGRLPCSGRETVLDSLQFAGGLLPFADRSNIRLNRPARGEKPARSYRIDLDAIERGEKKANLQVFPGDRLLIGRQGDRKPPVN